MRPEFANEDNIIIFKDTLLKGFSYPHGITKKHRFAFQQYYADYNKKGTIEVLPIDSVTAATGLTGKTAILNMASYKRPGGGVAWGAKAQEESLFRCSNLAYSISNEHYPLEDLECLYTKNVTFFKGFDYLDMDPFTCDVITMAAYDLRDKGPKLDHIEYECSVSLKMSRVISAAIENEVDNLLLGAWGCGVFKNDPTFIANEFKRSLEVVNKHMAFEKVIFPIINDQNSVGNNYSIFKSILG